MAHRRILRNRGVLGIGWRHPLWWSPCHFRSNPIPIVGLEKYNGCRQEAGNDLPT